jgi:NADH-quinone oxidoreductase subunit N
MTLASAENILLIFIALELLSLSLYVLTAFNKRNLKSAEAALKYFLFGGMSAAFLLFGFSLVYGLSGELNLTAIATKLSGKTLDPLLLAAILMIVAGFGFKVAAVPFHLWAPDTYEGAPLPSAAFIASGSKVASFFVLAKVMMVGLDGAAGSGAWRAYGQGWIPVLAVSAGLSVVLGNLAAIAQRSVRRLLAYSAVAHAGYLLVGLLANRKEDGIASLLFYVTTYALTTVGAFAVVGVVQENAGNDELHAFAGLSRRAPVLSFCMMIFLLSLAGIPPLAGFFGKFYLFKAGLFVTGSGAKSLGLLWLVALAIAMSAVSLYYYLQVLKQVFVSAPPSGAPPLLANRATGVTVFLLAAIVVLLGCAPDLFLSRILAAITPAIAP